MKVLAELDHPTLANPELTVGGTRVVFPCKLVEGERLCYFPGEAPYIIARDQSPRHKLPKVADMPLTAGSPITFSAAQPFTASARLRLVQDCPEEIGLR